jgi:CBS domain-containing protein
MRVKELMSTNVVTVVPETTLKDVAELLTEHGISGVPVCDADGRVVGVVSESDILWKELGTPSEGHGVIDRLLAGAYGDDKRAKARTAGEAMSSPAVTIAPNASIAWAARTMLECMINRLPVVSDGRLVGILARSDLVRAFERPDEEIEPEIEAVLRELWIDRDRVSVTVTRGEVVVAGDVENRSAAIAIKRHIGRIPGVVSVLLKLRWQIDDRSRRVAAAANHLAHKL